MSERRKAIDEVSRCSEHSSSVIHHGIDKVKNFLKDVTIGEYLAGRPPSQVISFDVDTTIYDTLFKLDQCNILSAPLFDKAQGAYYGFVDRWDILDQVLRSIDLSKLKHAELMYHLRKLGEALKQQTLSVFTSLEDGELVYKANKSHSLYDVVHYGFARTHGRGGKNVCHRIAIFDFPEDSKESLSDVASENNNASPRVEQLTEPSEACSEFNVDVSGPLDVQAIISQSDILRHLYQNRNLFSELLSLSVADLKISEKPVVCVPVDMTAMHTFASMRAFDVTSAGIVDNHNGGRLVANFSASDLRSLQAKDFPLLALPVITFLMKRHARKAHSTTISGAPVLQDWGLHKDSNTYPVLDAISPESSLKDAIEHLVLKRHHRIYVVDQEGRPQDVALSPSLQGHSRCNFRNTLLSAKHSENYPSTRTLRRMKKQPFTLRRLAFLHPSPLEMID